MKTEKIFIGYVEGNNEKQILYKNNNDTFTNLSTRKIESKVHVSTLIPINTIMDVEKYSSPSNIKRKYEKSKKK